MNKSLKIIIVIVNFLMLILAIFWFFENNEYEPAIVIFGQLLVLLGLIFEKPATSILTKKIDNSLVNVEVVSGGKVKAEEVKDSEINIKTR